MIPAANAPLGRRSRTAVAETAARSTRRRMGLLWGARRPCLEGWGAGQVRPEDRPDRTCSYPPRPNVNAPLGLRPHRPRRPKRVSSGSSLGPTFAASHALIGSHALPGRPGVPERGVATDPVGAGREAGAADQRLVAQEDDPRMVARIAARRGLQRLAVRLDPGAAAAATASRARARRVVGDRVAEAGELVAREDVVAGAGEEARRGDLRVQARRAVRRGRGSRRTSASCTATCRARSACRGAGGTPYARRRASSASSSSIASNAPRTAIS